LAAFQKIPFQKFEDHKVVGVEENPSKEQPNERSDNGGDARVIQKCEAKRY
jgi:hypothetical protein